MRKNKGFLLFIMSVFLSCGVLMATSLKKNSADEINEVNATGLAGDKVDVYFDIAQGGNVFVPRSDNDETCFITSYFLDSNQASYGTTLTMFFYDFDGWSIDRIYTYAYSQTATYNYTTTYNVYHTGGTNYSSGGPWSYDITTNEYSSYIYWYTPLAMSNGDYVAIKYTKNTSSTINYIRYIRFTLIRNTDYVGVTKLTANADNVTIDLAKGNSWTHGVKVHTFGGVSSAYTTKYNNKYLVLEENGKIVAYATGKCLVRFYSVYDENITLDINVTVVDSRSGYKPSTVSKKALTVPNSYSSSLSTFDGYDMIFFCGGDTSFMKRDFTLTDKSNYYNHAIETNEEVAFFIPEKVTYNNAEYYRLHLLNSNKLLVSPNLNNYYASFGTDDSYEYYKTLFYINGSNRLCDYSGYELRVHVNTQKVCYINSSSSTSSYSYIYPRYYIWEEGSKPTYYNSCESFWEYFRTETDRFCSNYDVNEENFKRLISSLIYYKNTLYSQIAPNLTSSQYDIPEYIQRYVYMINKYTSVNDILGLRTVKQSSALKINNTSNNNVLIVVISVFTLVTIGSLLILKTKEE